MFLRRCYECVQQSLTRFSCQAFCSFQNTLLPLEISSLGCLCTVLSSIAPLFGQLRAQRRASFSLAPVLVRDDSMTYIKSDSTRLPIFPLIKLMMQSAFLLRL